MLKTILIEVTKLDYFTVYTRYGQAIFTTSQINKGWNSNVVPVNYCQVHTCTWHRGKDDNGKKFSKKERLC